jgi:hypothetical protein
VCLNGCSSHAPMHGLHHFSYTQSHSEWQLLSLSTSMHPSLATYSCVATGMHVFISIAVTRHCVGIQRGQHMLQVSTQTMLQARLVDLCEAQNLALLPTTPVELDRQQHLAVLCGGTNPYQSRSARLRVRPASEVQSAPSPGGSGCAAGRRARCN